ncbi:MAG: aspartate aminotransferase family protein [Spirochaetia bacterium]|nr:aspartate aminotransferase family protein [Spirochaetia bacterium]
MKKDKENIVNKLYDIEKIRTENIKKEEKNISYNPEQVLSLNEIKSLDEKYLLQVYARMPVSFVYGSGEFLYDTEGNEYIDFLSGIAVNSLGHANADIVETIRTQADKLWHTSNLYYNSQQALLARALVEISFSAKVFFANSGTEANEAAIKFARAYGQKMNTTKTKIIALKSSFHGRTFGSMSITGQSKIHDGFGPLLENIEFIEANNIKSLEKAVNKDTCALILEPVLGEGGILPLENEFLEKAREICDKNKTLLIFDEIQTGIGRTGKYFAYQHSSVTPDLLTIAKGLGSGFPIGALLVSNKYNDIFDIGSHGSTFGGNHLACAVGYEVLRVIESGKVLENVNNISEYLFTHLNNIKNGFPEKIQEIRGKGLLIGIVLKENIQARPLVAKALEKNLVIGRASDNVIRLAPPLIVRIKTCDRALEKIEELISEI